MAAARAGVVAWIEDYNHYRIHTSIAMTSPIEYEHRLAARAAGGPGGPGGPGGDTARAGERGTPVPVTQRGAVLAGVKATPCGPDLRPGP